MEKPYLNLHFKFHYFFLPWNNEDVNILSFVFFSWVILKYATTHNHPQVCFISHFIYCFLVKLIAFVSIKSNSFDVKRIKKIWIYELLLINIKQRSVQQWKLPYEFLRTLSIFRGKFYCLSFATVAVDINVQTLKENGILLSQFARKVV